MNENSTIGENLIGPLESDNQPSYPHTSKKKKKKCWWFALKDKEFG